MAFLDENGVAQLWAAVKDRLAGAFDNVEFDIAEQAANLVSGDSIATAFGKLAKNYTSLLTSISDLNANLTSQINTKLNKSDVLANYTTTATGKALDASLGPAIKTKMDLADTLNTRVIALTGKLVVAYHDNLAPRDGQGNIYSVLKKDTSTWLTIPITKTGYHAVGVLGYYMYAAAGTGQTYYASNMVYEISPSSTGATMAVTTSNKGDWVNPRIALYILWEKDA